MSVKNIAVLSVICGVALGLAGCGNNNKRMAENTYSDSSEVFAPLAAFLAKI
jgi:hypothetical protein